jgi:NADPH:quinone reductase-like Zn-dependent oxidoreductase
MRVLAKGAAGGIGRATCLRIARERGTGARIAAVGSSDARYVNGHDLVVDGGVARPSSRAPARAVADHAQQLTEGRHEGRDVARQQHVLDR